MLIVDAIIEKDLEVDAEISSSIEVVIYDDTAIQNEVDLNTAKETNIAHPLVETAVPVGAVFTDSDTIYDDTAIKNEVVLHEGRIIILEGTILTPGSNYTKAESDILFSNKTIQITGVSLATSGWTLVGSFYEYDYANAGITASKIVDVIPDKSTINIVKAAEILPETLSGAGTVKLYSKNLPTANILVTINIEE